MLADGLGTFFSSVHAEDRKPVRLPLAVWPTCLIRFSASKLRLPSAFSPLPCDLCLLSFMVQSIVDTQRE